MLKHCAVDLRSLNEYPTFSGTPVDCQWSLGQTIDGCSVARQQTGFTRLLAIVPRKHMRKNMVKSEELPFFEGSPPWHTILTFLAYTLTFYLVFSLAFHLAWCPRALHSIHVFSVCCDVHMISFVSIWAIKKYSYPFLSTLMKYSLVDRFPHSYVNSQYMSYVEWVPLSTNPPGYSKHDVSAISTFIP